MPIEPGASQPDLTPGESRAGLPGFDAYVVTAAGHCDPSLAIAGARAGAVGLLDLTYARDAGAARRAVGRLARLARGRFGLILSRQMGPVERSAIDAVGGCDTIVLAGHGGELSPEMVEPCRAVCDRVGLIVTCASEARRGEAMGVDFLVAKGHEAGGEVGEETTFVLLQRLLAGGTLPVVGWGGIGFHTAAACRVAGAAGVVLDWQLSLLRESPISSSMRKRIAVMDGSETVAVRGPSGRIFRSYTRPGMTGADELQKLADELSGEEGANPAQWDSRLATLLANDVETARLWPIGQDASFAATWAGEGPTVSRVLGRLFEHVEQAVTGAAKAEALGAGGALARSHGTTFPVVQGPMTRVSDVPAFADAVESGGGLPFLALALMGEDQVRGLLNQTREVMGDRPWGVGILGFVERELRARQLSVIEEVRPPYAIIAGGRPDQAAAMEAKGIATYLHVPSPGMLEMFLGEGARRFIFEGRECGGHVGPRTSFVLWDTMIRVLLSADLSDEEAGRVHVLLAGGVHDAVSGSMVAAMAQPLVERGMKIGVLLGTGYLFTKEIVETGAVVPGFQIEAMATDHTVLLETGPGHATRCADTAFYRDFQAEKRRLMEASVAPEAMREELERMNLGRLRIASKGIQRKAHPRAGESPYESVNSEAQHREGMYMLGQLAGLRTTSCTIRELHESVCDGAVVRLRGRVSSDAMVVENRQPVPAPLDVAIIGMGCLLPGAKNVQEFWHNVLTGRDVIGEVPEDRFDVRRWYDPDRTARDKVYSKWGGFLEDVPFDPLKYAIPPAAIRSIEPMQLLALELVDQTLRDAGYAEDNRYRDRTGVIFGVGGGIAELGASYAFRAMLPQFVASPDESLWGQLPEWTEDSFAGILLNVVAGRVANRFDFGGANYTVDAACASSLAAIYLACRELAAGTADMVITGGCDTVQNPLSYLCFAKAGALSPRGRSRTFDESADGIVISEGLAAVVLKRREDAERDGDRIYAVIRAVAGGSDGRSKGIATPRREGQERTMQRAYDQAGLSPATIGLYEAHGTGTSVGDQSECLSIRSLLERHGTEKQGVAIGSVKSMIGHTKCTAGVAGLMKTALSLYHRVLPPTIHVETPNAKAGLLDGPLYVNSELRPWIGAAGSRRAAVSSFGFGGSNFHAVLEEYADDPVDGSARVPDAHWPTELFVLVGGSPEDLAKQARTLVAEIGPLAQTDGPSLAEVAYALHERGRSAVGSHRAAIVSSSIEALTGQLTALADALDGGPGQANALPAGVYYTDKPLGVGTPVAFLFPGQGAQFPDMMRDLAVTFSEVSSCFATADGVLAECMDPPVSRLVFPPPQFSDEQRERVFERLKATEVAQPALGVCGVAMMRLLASFGIRPAMAGGHSFGELIALHAAGCYDEDELYRLSRNRGESIVGLTRGKKEADLGGMLAVRADESVVRAAVETCSDVWVANLNSRQQIVVSGTKAGLRVLAKMLDDQGIDSVSVPVACAFHSPIMAPAREAFGRVLARMEMGPPAFAVYSNTTAEAYSPSADAIRENLAKQLVSEVRFADEIEAMHAAGARLFIEAGPKNILSRLVDETLGDRPHAAVPTNLKGVHGVTGLHHALGALFAHGLDVNPDRLYDGRDLTSIDLRQAALESEPEHGKHVWLVNGGYARPAADPPRVPVPRTTLSTASGQRARSTPPVGLPAEGPSAWPELPVASNQAANGQTVHEVASGAPWAAESDAFGQFQETMRVFLETQQAVMQAYLEGESSAAMGAQPAEPTQMPSPPPAPVDDASAGSVAPAPLEPSGLPDAGREAEVSDETAAATSPEATPPHGVLLEEILISTVSERTGYPAEMLELDANMEADLGIDSIKRVEIIGAFRRTVLPSMTEPPNWFMEQMTSAGTMAEILDGLTKLMAGEEAGVGSRVGDRGPIGLKPAARREEKTVCESQVCPRCLVRPVETPPGETAIDLPDGLVVLTDDDRGVARALAERIEAGGGRAAILDESDLAGRASTEAAIEALRKAHGSIGGVIHLRPLRKAPVYPGITWDEWAEGAENELASLLYLLQAIAPELKAAGDRPVLAACVSLGGGDFAPRGDGEGIHPWRGGLAGLLKTAATEWPDARFRCVDVDALPEAEMLLGELRADGPVEVGYRGRRRLTLEVVRGELPAAGPDTPAIELDADSVVLVTGGGRGITAQGAHEIALHTQATMILLGRSPMPVGPEAPATARLTDPAELRKAIIGQLRESTGAMPKASRVEKELARLLGAREIRRTLEAIEQAGSRVEYISCDVRDAEALGGVVADVTNRFGGIDAVVHGAGVIEDKYLVDKSAESLARVIGTKIDPMLTLTEVLDQDRLKLLMVFSSVAGYFGNPGQADYAAANEILNRMMRRLSSVWPGKMVAMNWGPWSGVGMVTPEVARQFESRGVGMVPVGGGRAAVWNEILHRGDGEVRVLAGPGPWVDAAEEKDAANRKGGGGVGSSGGMYAGLESVFRLHDGLVEARVVLDALADDRLGDHSIQGKPVLPFTMALELMAELAAAAEPTWHVARVENMRLFSGVVLENGQREIALRAEPIERDETSGRWRVRITDLEQAGRAFYEATVLLAAEPMPCPDVPALDRVNAKSAVGREEAYDRWLFHGPAFHAIARIDGLDAGGMDAALDGGCWRSGNGRHVRAPWLIDPIVLDAAPQMAIVWSRATHDTTPLPNRLAAYHCYGPFGEGPVEALFRVSPESDGAAYKADVWFVRDGKVVGLMQGLEGAGSAELNKSREGAVR